MNRCVFMFVLSVLVVAMSTEFGCVSASGPVSIEYRGVKITLTPDRVPAESRTDSTNAQPSVDSDQPIRGDTLVDSTQDTICIPLECPDTLPPDEIIR